MEKIAHVRANIWNKIGTTKPPILRLYANTDIKKAKKDAIVRFGNWL